MYVILIKKIKCFQSKPPSTIQYIVTERQLINYEILYR